MKYDIDTPLNSINRTLKCVSDEDKQDIVEECIVKIFEIQENLQENAKDFGWKGLGNLLGDYGEYLAAKHYEITLAPPRTKDYDAIDAKNRTVQIKACFHSKQIGLRGKANLLLVLRINRDGSHEEIYNGPFDDLPTGSWSGTDTKHIIQHSQLQAVDTSSSDKVAKRVL